MSKILLTVNGETFRATLESNHAVEAFLNRLPIVIKMNEMNGNEKYYDFSEGFPTESERVDRVKSGELMLFGSNTLVLFYKNFSTAYTYTRLGALDNLSNLAKVLGRKDVSVKIEQE
ncbi:hypothetical protein C8U37_10958 [Trichococcus patagoniensis]|uniref:Cyclophilin-like domain-containing protein n=1 Tax=Trichococcus patagoniensis TaxID=382641 RepID=A0A2T5IKF0_9LACT|nr:cyclophilin-like fold protein [Trichococcus patagoniensis]PTQ84291.1 hypothetical protein C8U37_10958 [Trichococcus patagoniensis]